MSTEVLKKQMLTCKMKRESSPSIAGISHGPGHSRSAIVIANLPVLSILYLHHRVLLMII